MTYLLVLALMLLVPIVYLRYAKGMNNTRIEKELLPKPQGLKKEIIGSLALASALIIGFFVITLGMSVAEGALHAFMGTDVAINDLTKVSDSIAEDISSGAESFLFTIIVTVFLEEFFFRAFLTQRIGIIPSSVIFALAHIGYGSIAEVIGAFLLGLVLAYWFKRNKSLIQNYVGHLLYDLFAVLLYYIIGVA